MAAIACNRCGKVHKIEEEKKPSSFAGLAAKWGGIAAVGYFAFSFLALFLLVATIFIIDGLGDSSSSAGENEGEVKNRSYCKNCGFKLEK